ncbi:hypothetical protein ACVMIH_000211 [Bradyrhizobium sp. USDA 4503]
MISETIDCATGNSMPMPKPSSRRDAPSAVAVVDRPQHRLPSPQKIMLTWKTRARPKRSASRPADAAPANMPRKLMLDSSPVSAVDRPKVWRIEPSTKVSAARSMLSKNHAVAMIPKIQR